MHLEVSLKFFIEVGVKALFFLSNTFVDFLLDELLHVGMGEAWFVGGGLSGVFSDRGDFFGVVGGFSDLVGLFLAKFEVIRVLEEVSA